MESFAFSGSFSSDLKELATVANFRDTQVSELELFHVMCEKIEHLRWPLLQLFIVIEVLNGQVIEALHFLDCSPKVVDHRVEHIGRCSLESIDHLNFGDGLILDDRVNLVERVSGVLHEA